MMGAARGRRLVVLVDDARECMATLEAALCQDESLDVRCCSTAEEALDLIRLAIPDALVTDIHLPGMSGVALIREMRSRPGGSRMRIIAVSGAGDPCLADLTLSAGADVFFAKPYSPLEVRRVLEDLIHEEP